MGVDHSPRIRLTILALTLALRLQAELRPADARPKLPAGVGAVMTVGKEFAFEVGLLARVRVRAANESSARQVVPSVIGAPGAHEIALANEGNGALWDCDVVVTSVDFFADGKIKLVRR